MGSLAPQDVLYLLKSGSLWRGYLEGVGKCRFNLLYEYLREVLGLQLYSLHFTYPAKVQQGSPGATPCSMGATYHLRGTVPSQACVLPIFL